MVQQGLASLLALGPYEIWECTAQIPEDVVRRTPPTINREGRRFPAPIADAEPVGAMLE